VILLDTDYKSIKDSLNRNYRNMRIVYGMVILLTILLGLASRKYGYLLPAFISQHAGDALWAMMVYFGFRFLLVRGSIMNAFLLGLLFSFGIEFSQLYQEAWINEIRSHILGGLILGKGFLVIDLVRYTFGIIIAVILDKIARIWLVIW
jgi:glycopeptide antibiotics resistance protein